MAPGVMRFLPFALISTVLHAIVFVSMPERLEIAVTPGGDTGPVAVRLVPSGPTTPGPAAQSGVAGSIPVPSRDQDDQPAPTKTAAEATTPDEITAGEASASSEPKATEPDHAQAASANRITSESAPANLDQERVDTATTDTNDLPDESTTTSDAAEEPTNPVAAAEDRTSDTPSTLEKPDASELAESSDPAQVENPYLSDATATTPEVADHTPNSNNRDAAESDKQADMRTGADGLHDRAQVASRARQHVQIHFRNRFRYPRIARQRGWEGRVVLTFRLQPDGRITDVEVTESSGRFILDENARQTLIHIERVPELADRLGPEPLELEVPVTYRLQPA